MTHARVVIVPIHGQVRRRRFDLALALAILSHAVKAHDRAGRARRAPHALAGSEHAKSLGA